MDFFDSVVKSSNALIKEKLNNPFGSKQASQPTDASQLSSVSEPPSTDATLTTRSNEQQNRETNPSVNSHGSASSASGQSQGNESTVDDTGSSTNSADKFAAIAADAEAVRKNAVKGAKNIGSFLFSMANKAGQTVSQTAKQVKQAVESTSILTDFTREQQEFIREHGGSMQAGDLPWADCSDEARAAEIRDQILTLSQDKRNFVRNPPNEANFEFDTQNCYPIALTMLREDPNLSKMRFELVPKLVNEDTFWRNYFYRVSLLKQMTNHGEDIRRDGWSSSRSSSGEGPDEITTTEDVNPGEETMATYSSSMDQRQADKSSIDVTDNPLEEPTNATDFFVDDNDLKNKLKELNIGSLDEASGQDG